jgi:hypothetical protein
MATRWTLSRAMNALNWLPSYVIRIAGDVMELVDGDQAVVENA